MPSHHLAYRARNGLVTVANHTSHPTTIGGTQSPPSSWLFGLSLSVCHWRWPRKARRRLHVETTVNEIVNECDFNYFDRMSILAPFNTTYRLSG